MKLGVYSLFLATFCIGTTEVVIAGLLPAIAAEMQVDIPTAGFLVTGYALSVAIGGPILTLLSARFPRRSMILVLMGLFIAGHVIAAIASSYEVLLAARILTATAHGCFFGLAMIVAIGLVPDEHRGRAMSLVFLGISIANVIGVPAGTYIGTTLGWRATFWILGGIAAVAATAIALFIPSDPSGGRISIRAQLSTLCNSTVLTSFAIIILAWTALWSTLTYIAPVLIEFGGLTEKAVSLTMLAFGVGLTVGIFVGGRLADLAPNRTLIVGLPVAAVLFTVSLLLAHNGIAYSVTLLLLGVALATLVTPLQNRVLRGAAAAPDLASTLTSSAYNVGIAAGAFVGAGVLNLGFGYDSIPAIGLVATAMAAVVCGLALAADRRHIR
ncbi:MULTISPECIES: MFS transporter [unclassified Mesorhizobium]|uniref:MFS transporter n=1 Tax=unclassified Mesorhizobium TaxID=325217 RepID=UPI0016516416|nr:MULTISPECIES: MFS transporter [unclassified Mesorhizobium]